MKMNSSYISASAARKRLCFRLAPMIAIATVIATGQDCPPGGGGEATCYVQYRTATANKSKCQFQEFTEFQVPPRLRMYLKQTSIRQSDEFSSGGVGYGPNCTMTNEAGFNLKTNWLSILETETITTERTTCMSTGVYSGSYHQGVQIEDSRFVLCDNGPCEHYRTYYHHRWSLDQSVQYIYHNGQMQWVWVGNDNTQTSSDGWEDCDGTVTWDGTNSTTIPFTNVYIFGIPPVTPVSATHAVWMPDPPVSGHSASVQLEEEYTDADLYSDIMGRMPAYADGWYTPGPYDPLLYRSAYSLIHMNHTTGPFGGWGFNAPGAELQKMQYRFCVPQSGRKTAYYITWDIITYNFSTGVWTRDGANTTVVGTGGTDDACSAEFYAAPPDWDQSNYHGFVIRWVDNVKVTITTRSPDPKKPVPGKGSLGGTTLGEGNDCGGCGGKVGLIGALESGGIQLGFSMGQASNGISAESLNIRSALPNLDLASTAGLSYTSFDPSIEVIWASGQIRQVKSPQALADVVTLSAFAYEIRYYLPSQVGSLVSGIYQVSGNPFVTWKIENPDASTNTFNRLRVSETRGSEVKSYDYTYTPAANKWTLDYPGNLRQDEWTAVITTNAPPIYMGGTAQGGYFPAFYRTVTNTIRVPGGPDQYKAKRVYRQFRWGESLIEETISPEADPKTTTYAYDEVYGYGNATIQPLKLVTHPDGSWKYYERDGSGRITATYSGFGDTPAPTSGTPNPALCRKTEYDYNALSSSGDDGSSFYYVPRTTVEYAKGSEVSRHYTIILPGERRDIRCQSPSVWWDASDNLVTITKYYTSGVNTNRVQSIERPDRTMTIFEYAQAVNGSQTNTVYTGQPNGSKTAITNGTKEVTILGPLSEMISRTVTDIASTILLSADTYSNCDEFNRPTRVTHLDGTYEDTIYACCGLDSTIDRDGVITQYHIDAMKRQTATVRQNITTTNILDAVGRTLKTIRIGSDGSPIVLKQASYHPANDLVYETNALNGVTSYAESVDGSGHRVRTTTYPDGGTRIETYYNDGSLLSVTGTAEFPVYYEYDVEYDSGLGITASFTKEIKGSPSGDEWTKTYADMLGRAYKTVYSAASGTPLNLSYYNRNGQMTNQVDPDGVSTLYAYNSKGELAYTITDSNRNYMIDWSGNDRISYVTNDVYNNGTANVRRSRTYVWNTSANASNLVSTTESSTDGLRSWNTVSNNGQALTSQSRTVFGGSGYRFTTNIAPDNSFSVSVSRYGTNVSATRYDSLSNQLSSVTFAHDAHGRQNRITDARNGTTTNWFNDADQVNSTSSPAPGAGQSAQVTTNYFDASLRIWKTTLPDNTSVTNKFDVTGLLTNTSGSRTYPVAYTYDFAGRMKTMKTWKNFSSGEGAATTTWNYDPYRGWLANKRFANPATGEPSEIGTDYTYTAAGRMETRTWARTVGGTPLVTTYSYNDAGDLSGVDYSDTTPDVASTYDRLGRQKTIAHNSTTTTFTYNDAGLVLTESYSGGTLNGLSVTNGYDQYLRRTNLTALNGSTVLARSTYGYDSASRLKSVGDGVNTAAYGYLANSPLVGNVWFTNNTTLRMTTTKSYDYLNRLTAISSAAGASNVSVFSYANNPANHRTAITNVDSSRWVYQYDNLGQVVSGKKYWADGTPVAGQQFEYTFDDIGNRKNTAAGGDQLGANLRSANYTANSLNQYSSRDVPGYVSVLGSAKTNATVSLWSTNSTSLYATTTRKGEYFHGELPLSNSTGAVWMTITNLAVLQNGSNPDIVTNTIGQTFVPKTAENFYYDFDGNLTNDGRWTYTWDAENRLVRMVANTATGPQQRLDFEFDSKGRRTGKKVWNNTTGTGSPALEQKFVYDGWNLVSILNPQSSILQSFTWGLDLSGSEQGAGGVGGLLLCRDTGTTTTNYVAYDGNGNVMALVNAASGAVTANYEYGPFGEPLRVTGALARSNPFRFSTKYQEDETDHLYYGYRSYNPSTGSWLSRDPIDEPAFILLLNNEVTLESNPALGGNPYGFVGNDPITYFDVLGFWRAGEHRSLTKIAWDNARLPSELVGIASIYKTIEEANIAVDHGASANDLRRHYNRALNADIANAKQRYSEWLRIQQTSFDNLLEHPGRTSCDLALRVIGQLSHSWQDHYAHAIGNNSPFRGDPGPIGGDPDHLSAELKPCSWGGVRNWGEHGFSEPAWREADGGADRAKKSADFVAAKFRGQMPKWWNACHCYYGHY